MRSFAALLFLILATTSAHADRWGSYIRERWKVGGTIDYLHSTENFKTNGNRIDLTNSGRYTEMPFKLTARYDIERTFSFFSHIGFNSAESIMGTVKRSSTAVTEWQIGGDAVLMKGAINLIPEFKITVPLATFQRNTDQIILHEGAYEFQGGLYISRPRKVVSLSAYVGYNFRTDGRSALLPWDFTSRLKLGRFFIEAQGVGAQSVSDDADSGVRETDRQLVLDRVNGGSYRYFSVNPNSIHFRGALGFALRGGGVVKVGYGIPLTGQRVAGGNIIFAAFEMAIGGSRVTSDELGKTAPDDSSDEPPRRRNRFKQDLQDELSFTPDMPEDDEELFNQPVKPEDKKDD